MKLINKKKVNFSTLIVQANGRNRLPVYLIKTCPKASLLSRKKKFPNSFQSSKSDECASSDGLRPISRQNGLLKRKKDRQLTYINIQKRMTQSIGREKKVVPWNRSLKGEKKVSLELKILFFFFIARMSDGKHDEVKPGAHWLTESSIFN